MSTPHAQCDRDCEFCDGVQTCEHPAAANFQAELEAAHDAEAGRNPVAEHEPCFAHAVVMARLERIEDLVSRIRREMNTP